MKKTSTYFLICAVVFTGSFLVYWFSVGERFVIGFLFSVAMTALMGLMLYFVHVSLLKRE